MCGGGGIGEEQVWEGVVGGCKVCGGGVGYCGEFVDGNLWGLLGVWGLWVEWGVCGCGGTVWMWGGCVAGEDCSGRVGPSPTPLHSAQPCPQSWQWPSEHSWPHPHRDSGWYSATSDLGAAHGTSFRPGPVPHTFIQNWAAIAATRGSWHCEQKLLTMGPDRLLPPCASHAIGLNGMWRQKPARPDSAQFLPVIPRASEAARVAQFWLKA